MASELARGGRVGSSRSVRAAGATDSVTLRSLAQELLESDCRYFESDAQVEQLAGASLVRMKGLESHSAGCVVQRVNGAGVVRDPDQWLSMIEERLLSAGCHRVRLYLQHRNRALEAALIRCGYRARDEIGFMTLIPGSPAAPPKRAAPTISLHPIERPSDWLETLSLYERSEERPDGHESAAEECVELEKRKAAAGYMQPFLIMVGDRVVGAAAAAPQENLLRLKNLLVHPAFRRQGIATAAINGFVALVARYGKQALGCFALAGEVGESLYPRCGFRAITRQMEWLKNRELE